MALDVFGSKYASNYDLLYQDKDYSAESERIDGIIKKFEPRASKLLELGSGTGNHTVHLARKYSVTSVERSPFMLEIARSKVHSLPVNFVQADITEIPDLNGKFDVCISMFHVLNYILSREMLVSILRRLHSFVDRNGLLIFDSWNGLAVLKERPAIRVKEVQNNGLRVIRTVQPNLNAYDNICENIYRIMVLENQKLIDEYVERHKIRYLFPMEIREILQDCNFELLQLSSDDGKELTESDWSMQIIAKFT